MNQDFVDLLHAFSVHDVRHLIVGAFALAVHGVARATGDIDVWVQADPENARRVILALREFGAPLRTHGVDFETFQSPGNIYQMGLPPSRIDVLTSIDGIAFDEAWATRTSSRFGDIDVPVLGLDALRRNKRASGRPKDLADLALLAEVHGD